MGFCGVDGVFTADNAFLIVLRDLLVKGEVYVTVAWVSVV